MGMISYNCMTKIFPTIRIAILYADNLGVLRTNMVYKTLIFRTGNGQSIAIFNNSAELQNLGKTQVLNGMDGLGVMNFVGNAIN